MGDVAEWASGNGGDGSSVLGTLYTFWLKMATEITEADIQHVFRSGRVAQRGQRMKCVRYMDGNLGHA